MNFLEMLGQAVTAPMRAAADLVEKVTTPEMYTSWDDVVPTAKREFFKDQSDLALSVSGPGYNHMDAWLLAEFSHLTYHDGARANEYFQPFTNRGWKLDVLSLEDFPETYALLAMSGEVAVLAFRGTRLRGFPSFQDWFQRAKEPISWVDLFTDLHFQLDSAGVHAGINEAFERWWGTYKGPDSSKLTDKLAKVRRVFFTGHSLGGSLAALAARRYCSDSNAKNAILYTYGCPRFCNESIRASYEKLGLPIYRVVHGSDFVSSIPPEELNAIGAAYVHAGDILLLPRGGSDVQPGGHQPHFLEVLGDASHSTIANVLINVITWRPEDIIRPPSPKFLLGAVSDHAPRYYSNGLRAAALKS